MSLKLETTVAALRSALLAVAPATKNGSSIPVLQTVLFSCGKVAATDLNMTIEAAFPVANMRGSACIPFRQLTALAKNLPADEAIKIDVGGEGAVLAFSGGRYVLPSINPDDFPPMNFGAMETIAVDGDSLRRAVQFALNFVSTEETRYYLNGVCLDAAQAVGTDGHRMGIAPLGFDGAPFGRCIIPSSAARVLAKMGPVAEISKASEKPGMVARSAGVTLTTRLIDGAFPEWPRVVPAEDDSQPTLCIETGELRKALRRITTVAMRPGVGLTLAWKAGRAVLVVNERVSETSVCEWLRGTTVSGKDGYFGFNATYLAGIVDLFRCPVLKLRVKDNGSPVRITGDGEALALLMPLRTADEKLAQSALAEQPLEQAA